MTRSEIVDTAYRVTPVDLQHGEHLLTISAVSLQGLEEIQPIAHFAETRKRLLLNPEHCRTLILLTGSSIFEDWVGLSVRVKVDETAPTSTVQLLPVTGRRRPIQARWLAATRDHVQTWLWALTPWFSRRAGTNALEPDGHAPTQPAEAVASASLKSDNLPRRWTAVDGAIPHTGPTWREFGLPGLVIALLSVVSFLYARAYGADLIQAIQGLLQGNGG